MPDANTDESEYIVSFVLDDMSTVRTVTARFLHCDVQLVSLTLHASEGEGSCEEGCVYSARVRSSDEASKLQTWLRRSPWVSVVLPFHTTEGSHW